MSVVTFDTVPYAKLVLHSLKYPYAAVNGVLLASKSQMGVNVAGNMKLKIVDSVQLFHRNHSTNAMLDAALSQIELVAQAENRMIVGYYASCENFKEYCVQSCVGQHIAQRIVQQFPPAVFIVIHNKKMLHTNIPTIKVHKYIGGSWTFQVSKKDIIRNPGTLGVVASLLEDHAQKDLIDFDNYFNNNRLDWTNQIIENMIANMSHSY